MKDERKTGYKVFAERDGEYESTIISGRFCFKYKKKGVNTTPYKRLPFVVFERKKDAVYWLVEACPEGFKCLPLRLHRVKYTPSKYKVKGNHGSLYNFVGTVRELLFEVLDGSSFPDGTAFAEDIEIVSKSLRY